MISSEGISPVIVDLLRALKSKYDGNSLIVAPPFSTLSRARRLLSRDALLFRDSNVSSTPFFIFFRTPCQLGLTARKFGLVSRRSNSPKGFSSSEKEAKT
ncbi:hypothetical protein D3C73_1375960 [compost metagenome]